MAPLHQTPRPTLADSRQRSIASTAQRQAQHGMPQRTAAQACAPHLGAIVRRQPRLILTVKVVLDKNGVVIPHAACSNTREAVQA